jgi:hypothetical protein
VADEDLEKLFVMVSRIASGNLSKHGSKLVTLGGGSHGIVFCKYMPMTGIVRYDSLEILDLRTVTAMDADYSVIWLGNRCSWNEKILIVTAK